jgi:hypothetical protein
VSAVILLNGTPSERTRSSEGVTVDKCGCAYTATLWLQQCRKHYDESEALAAGARASRAELKNRTEWKAVTDFDARPATGKGD